MTGPGGQSRHCTSDGTSRKPRIQVIFSLLNYQGCPALHARAGSPTLGQLGGSTKPYAVARGLGSLPVFTSESNGPVMNVVIKAIKTNIANERPDKMPKS